MPKEICKPHGGGRKPTVPGGLAPITIRVSNPTLQWLRSLKHPSVAHAIRDILDHQHAKADK